MGSCAPDLEDVVPWGVVEAAGFRGLGPVKQRKPQCVDGRDYDDGKGAPVNGGLGRVQVRRV